MIRRVNKLLSVSLVIVLFSLPVLVSAQETTPSAVAPSPEPTPAPSLVSAPEPTSVPETVPVPITETATVTEAPVTQEATSTQESISSSDLEDTSNPQPSTAPVTENATTTSVTTETSTTTQVTTVIVEPVVTQIIETVEATTTPVTELSEEVLEPEKEYTFDINGSGIATKENPEWTLSLEEKIDGEVETPTVTEEPYINVDANPNTLSVSGACSDSYFVVLLYKNEKDYDNNPSSYLYNRAFPCVNGQYNYSLSELPFSLETDTYYLLVAGQGDKGPWHPISAMIPVGITVKTIIPKTNGDELEP